MNKLKKISLLCLVGLLLISMSQAAVAAKGKVDLNTASKKELVTLKHVGDKIADRIIEYRTKHPFKKTEEIMQVKGIGPKVYEANKSVITVKNE